MKAMVCLICVPAFKCQPIGYEDDTVEGKRKEQAFISSERPYITRGRQFKFGGNKPLKLVNYQLPPPPRLQRVNPRQAKRPGAIPTRKRMILIRRLTEGETTNDATLRRNEQPVQEKPGQPYRKSKKPPPRQSPLGGRGCPPARRCGKEWREVPLQREQARMAGSGVLDGGARRGGGGTGHRFGGNGATASGLWGSDYTSRWEGFFSLTKHPQIGALRFR